MLYTLLLRSWYCITPATLSIFVLYTVRFNCASISAACYLLLARHCAASLLVVRWLRCQPSLLPLQRSGLPSRLVLQSPTRPCDANSPECIHVPSLSWFLVRLSLLLGMLITILLIDPSACSWLCSFISSDRSGLQLAMLFLPAVGTALSCSFTSLSVCFP